MIQPKNFYRWLTVNQVDFFCGVPDSLLKDICAYITDNTAPDKNMITANEGNAIALAAGYHMSTEKIPMVYMQNSGLGNTVNPLLSLSDKKVYNIPVLLMIGWRGEPGVKDEPQHIKQGEVTLDLLESMQIPYLVLDKEEQKAEAQIKEAIAKTRASNAPFALVIRKGTFEKYTISNKPANKFEMLREEAIQAIVDQFDGNEVIVSTTGKTSRELFEYRETKNQHHSNDFLTVGCMGHASQIALGIAMNKPDKKVICIDGDGALLMHMGALAIVGNASPKNFIHIVINNGAHESVGGQPTVAFNIDIPEIALANRYKSALSVETKAQLINTMQNINHTELPALIEVKVNQGARPDLGRPTIQPVSNKQNFMKKLNGE